MTEKKRFPRHYQIAIDIAQKIKQRKIKEGVKLSGRSIAAAEYDTSTETVRKAFALLREYNVIRVKEKSGAIVLSREAAISFLNIFKSETNIKSLFQELDLLLEKKFQIEKEIKQLLKRLRTVSGKYRSDLPFDYFEVKIHEDYFAVGKPIKKLDLYDRTGGTLFGLLTNGKPLKAIYDDYIIQENDILYISGSYEVSLKSILYLKEGN